MPTKRDRYVWSDDDRERYANRWWAVPRQIVEDGALARLWTSRARSRGGGAASSILPILAMHAWPERPSHEWSRWGTVPVRALAALSGLHGDTARSGLDQLEDAGLLERTREQMARGGYRTRYRLAGRLYARIKRESEPYARLEASLVYSGGWSMLPTAAARHLYIVIAAMDPIGDEDAYCADLEDTSQEPAYAMHEQRGRHPMSLLTLARWSGLNRATVKRTLPVLTVGMFDKRTIPLVRRGIGADGMDRWYWPDRRAGDWHWMADFLNDDDRVARERAALWPETVRPTVPTWAPCEGSGTWHAWEHRYTHSDREQSLCGHGHGRNGDGRRQPPQGERACLVCGKAMRKRGGAHLGHARRTVGSR